MKRDKKLWYLFLCKFWLLWPKSYWAQGSASNQLLRFFWYFLVSKDPKSWNLALIGQPDTIMLCPFLSCLWCTFAFFLHNIHFLHLNSCTAGVYLLSLGNKSSQAKWRLFTVYSLYFGKLLDDTCLLVANAQDFCILSCMLKTVFIKFLQIVFCLYFFMFLRHSLLKLWCFLQDVSLPLGLCFCSDEKCYGYTQTHNFILIRCMAYVGYLQM